MYPSRFTYQRARSLEEALGALNGCPDEVKILAGGQSLIPLMKLRVIAPPRLLDIGPLRDLSGIGKEDGLLKIGGLTRHVEMETFIPPEGLELLPQSARLIADPQVRNMGTVGGALAEADPAGDWGAVFLASDSAVICRSATGVRRINIADFFLDAYTTALKPDEILTEVELKIPRTQSGSAYLKFERKSGDFAVASAAVIVTAGEKGLIEEVGIGLSGVGLTPIKPTKAETVLKDQNFDPELVKKAGEVLMTEIEPLSDLRGSSEYKRDIARVLFERAFVLAWKHACRSN